jgi:hypothetical protein
MTIQLNGYGMFKVEENNFKRFLEICDMDTDLFLDMMNMYNNIGAVPILSINVEKIEKEGPIPYSHNQTEIGVTRMQLLEEENIISFVRD